MKVKIEPCPFCGALPSGKMFCSTNQGPALECDHCGCMGPGALDREFVGANEDKLNPLAIERWNKRALDSAFYRRGIEAAASFIEQFDKYVTGHAYLLSDCILGKFNILTKRRRIRKNPNYVPFLPDPKGRRTPVRRKGERRKPGGADFVLGSVMSKERRERQKREGAVRRRS